MTYIIPLADRTSLTLDPKRQVSSASELARLALEYEDHLIPTKELTRIFESTDTESRGLALLLDTFEALLADEGSLDEIWKEYLDSFENNFCF